MTIKLIHINQWFMWYYWTILIQVRALIIEILLERSTHKDGMYTQYLEEFDGMRD